MLHLGLEPGSRFLQAVDFVHENWHRWGVHLRQRLSQKRYCLKFLSSKFDFEEQSAAIWRQLVETHPTAACLSALLPFFIPRAQESSLLRAQQHRPIVVYNPQQQVINYIRAQFICNLRKSQISSASFLQGGFYHSALKLTKCQRNRETSELFPPKNNPIPLVSDLRDSSD